MIVNAWHTHIYIHGHYLLKRNCNFQATQKPIDLDMTTDDVTSDESHSRRMARAKRFGIEHETKNFSVDMHIGHLTHKQYHCIVSRCPMTNYRSSITKWTSINRRNRQHIDSTRYWYMALTIWARSMWKGMCTHMLMVVVYFIWRYTMNFHSSHR
jgi:hypothetical protein